MSHESTRPAAGKSSNDGEVRVGRRPARFCRAIAPVRLYLDDVEQIVAYLRELSPDADLVLVTPRREVSTVEGLSGLGQQGVSELEIRCSGASGRFCDLVVSIGPESAFLCRMGDTPAHRRAFLGIEAFLLARRRGWQWRTRLPVAAGLLGPLAGIVFVLARSSLSSWLLYLGAVLSAASLSLTAVYLVSKRWSRYSVVLANRQELRVHWEYMTGVLIVLALIAVMALVTMGLAALI